MTEYIVAYTSLRVPYGEPHPLTRDRMSVKFRRGEVVDSSDKRWADDEVSQEKIGTLVRQGALVSKADVQEHQRRRDAAADVLRGAPVPAQVSPEQLSAAEEKASRESGEQWTPPSTGEDNLTSEDLGEGTSAPARPSNGASTAVWSQYVTARQNDGDAIEVEPESASRSELIAAVDQYDSQQESETAGS